MHDDPSQFFKDYPDFMTVTCLEWKHLLTEDRFKDIIMQSLQFLVKERRVTVYAFVIMTNHFHLVWQVMGDHKRKGVQQDFLKFTSQRILNVLRDEKSPMLDELLVNAKDRKYQVWERNSLIIPIWSRSVMYQKLTYIHENPVRAGLCKWGTDYNYSSARFYADGDSMWSFLVHVEGYWVALKYGDVLCMATVSVLLFFGDDVLDARMLVGENTQQGRG